MPSFVLGDREIEMEKTEFFPSRTKYMEAWKYTSENICIKSSMGGCFDKQTVQARVRIASMRRSQVFLREVFSCPV